MKSKVHATRNRFISYFLPSLDTAFFPHPLFGLFYLLDLASVNHLRLQDWWPLRREQSLTHCSPLLVISTALGGLGFGRWALGVVVCFGFCFFVVLFFFFFHFTL